MIKIGQVFLEEKILHEQFACDLGQCHGACCTIPGGRGAPLRDDEVERINQALPVVKKYLPVEHQMAIESTGPVEGSPGNYATTCVNYRACVFVFYEGNIAKCSIERAYHANELSWRKPLSCHLFPLRINRYERTTLDYEPIRECDPGILNGRIQGVPLGNFLEEPLRRAFGPGWMNEFKDASEKPLRVNPVSAHKPDRG